MLYRDLWIPRISISKFCQNKKKVNVKKCIKYLGMLSQFSPITQSDSLQTDGLQHARLLGPSPTPKACSNSCPSSQWCHATISSSVVPFSYLQLFPASGSFPTSQFFTSGGQVIGVSASTSVLPMNTQDWSPLGWTGWISLQSKGLSRVFCNTTVQKHQFWSHQVKTNRWRNKGNSERIYFIVLQNQCRWWLQPWN